MEPIPDIPPLTDLISSLDQATLVAKHFPTTIADPSQLHQLFSSFQTAHHHLTSFLSRFPSCQPQSHIENSVSSAVGGEAEADEPMQIEDSEFPVEETEENSRIVIDKVEERLRNCVIQNKRRKRPLSPSSAVAEQRWHDTRVSGPGAMPVFDPQGTRLRSLDLVFQFHG